MTLIFNIENKITALLAQADSMLFLHMQNNVYQALI